MEAELYYKALPPGFRWTIRILPRIAIWILIILLFPVTAVYHIVKGRQDP